MTAMLQRVTFERRPDGRWDVVREREENGERLVADDLLHALDAVLVSYRPDGTPRTDMRRRSKRRLLKDWPQEGAHEGGRPELCGTGATAPEEGKART